MSGPALLQAVLVVLAIFSAGERDNGVVPVLVCIGLAVMACLMQVSFNHENGKKD